MKQNYKTGTLQSKIHTCTVDSKYKLIAYCIPPTRINLFEFSHFNYS